MTRCQWALGVLAMGLPNPVNVTLYIAIGRGAAGHARPGRATRSGLTSMLILMEHIGLGRKNQGASLPFIVQAFLTPLIMVKLCF